MYIFDCSNKTIFQLSLLYKSDINFKKSLIFITFVAYSFIVQHPIPQIQ